jgi:putative phosphoribosyl transferase
VHDLTDSLKDRQKDGLTDRPKDVAKGRGEMTYRDRADAGRHLARYLKSYAGPRAIALGLTRGGVAVAAEVARALGIPFDAIIVKKLGAPLNPEYAIGAVAESAEPVVNSREVAALGISPSALQMMVDRQRAAIDHLRTLYRGGAELPDLHDRTVLLVDDGIATGYTMRAAVAAARGAGASDVIVAVPVGPAESVESLRAEGVTVVCPQQPEPFLAVGLHYEDFSPVEDADVRRILSGAASDRDRGQSKAA